MASVKIQLFSNTTTTDDQLQQIVIRIIHNRVRRIVGLKHYALPFQWDEKNCRVKASYPNSKRMNTL